MSCRNGLSTPVTAADVLHSWDRLSNDPASLQKSTARPIAKIEARDQHTVVFTTKGPESVLLDYLKDRPVTSKAAFEKLGDKSYTEQVVSAGPYMFKSLVPDQHLILVKNPNYWGAPVKGPDEMVYRIIREAEVRVTALLNNEIQIAQFVPPHMDQRVADNPNTKVVPFEGIEMMFLAMRPDSCVPIFPAFNPALSVIDILMKCSRDEVRTLLKQYDTLPAADHTMPIVG